MATLTLPLTQGSGSSADSFYAPAHYSSNIPTTVSAQHIYSVTVKMVVAYNNDSYQAAWYNPSTGGYDIYTGPGFEPREEIPVYWNFHLDAKVWRQGGAFTIVTISDAIKDVWTAQKANWCNNKLFDTIYMTLELTEAETALLIEHINRIDGIHAMGYYRRGETGEHDIATGTFPVRSASQVQLHPVEYVRTHIRASAESCIIINYLPTGAIKPPTDAYAPESAPVQGVPILWKAPQMTDTEKWEVDITSYAIWRCNTIDGEYVKVGETDGPVLNYSDTTATPGTTWYYKIQAQSAEEPLYNSELSEPTAGTYVNHEPNAAVVVTGHEGTTYNQKPRILVTLGTDADNVTLQLAAQGYTASRTSAAPGARVAFIRTRQMELPGEETVTISETDPAGNVVTTDADVAYELPTWTDVPIIAGTTIVKAVHINELRAQLEELCDYYGMDAPVWSEDVEAGTTPSTRFATHATELQNVVRAIANKINTWDPESSRCNVTLPSLIEPQRPLAAVVNQLRDIIKIL